MINLNRVNAMVLRYFLYLRHNLDRLSDMFYWPAMDIFVWGLTGLYIASLGAGGGQTIFVILTGVVFWIVIWRAQYEINVNLMSEIWDKNLVNIFASPLTLPEWTLSLLLVGLIKMVLSVAFSAVLTFFLYGFNIFQFGVLLLPAVLSLLLTGWAAGFVIAGFLMYFGQKIQTLAWTGVAMIWPFSALYYSVSILPDWAQAVSRFIPPSYVFENMREVIFTGRFAWDKILVSFTLNIFYLILAIWFFVFMFKKSRKLGLGRLI
ncbi:ABC transporter permease [Candidatus Daviesbacteria bacterium]|nr:ABC transporter permease [Candidatus Daviesbacteria bacterium]